MVQHCLAEIHWEGRLAKESHQREVKRSMPYLNSSPQRQEGISAIAHLENAPKAILCKISYLQNLQLRRHRAEVELCDEDIIDNDGWFRGFVKSSRKQVAGALIEVFVGRERRPVEVEGHRAGV